MTYAIVLILVALSITLWRTHGRDQYQLMAVLQSTLAICAFWVIGDDITSGNGVLLFSFLAGLLLIHFVISRFWKKKNAWFPPLFILLSSGLFYLVQNELFTFNEFTVSLTTLPVVLLPFLGSIIVPVADMKEKVFGDFFKIDFKNRRGISRAVYVFLIGLFVFLGHFTASYIGVALVVVGFGANLFYNKKSGALWNMYLGLIALLLIGHMAQIGIVKTSDLLQGRVLEGLFFGGFVSLSVNTFGRAKKNKNVATLISWLLILIVPSILIFLGTQFVSLGGADAFIGLMVGFAFAAFLGINTRKNSSLLGVYFALGIFLLPMTINEELENMTTISVPSENKSDGNKEEVKKEKEVDIFEVAGKEIDLEGVHDINSKNSQLTFKLGPAGGITKGAFKSFSGSFDFSSDKINVNLPVKELTTFVKMRDEELMGVDYFNEPKFPMMRFVSNKMELTGDKYIVDGKFTMMGIEVEKTIEMKYLGKISEGGAPIFVGKAEVDRTKHGMKSDPKEGDIVSLTFKVELE